MRDWVGVDWGVYVCVAFAPEQMLGMTSISDVNPFLPLLLSRKVSHFASLPRAGSVPFISSCPLQELYRPIAIEMPDLSNANLFSSATELSNTEAAPNSPNELDEKEKKEDAKVEENLEEGKKDRDMKTRVENSVRGRIGKTESRQKGKLFRKVYAEEMERELQRRKETVSD